MTMFQKFWGTFCLNIGQIFEFSAYTKVTSRLSKMGLYKSYLTDVQNEGGGQGHITFVKTHQDGLMSSTEAL